MSVCIRLLVRREPTVRAAPAPLVDAVWQGLLPRVLAPPLFRPLVDLHETPEAVHLKVELAGVDEDSLAIAVVEELLIVEGVRPWQPMSAQSRVHLQEIQYGAFRVEVRLPARVDAGGGEAHLERGVLAVRLPRAKAS